MWGCKPQYYSPEPSHLIKATQPFERLNLDFKVHCQVIIEVDLC